MCGIVGYWNKQGEAKAEVYKCMAMQIRHRGPDDSGVWLDEAPGLGLAHQRLAVLIGAFGILAKRFPDWCLRIVGEGRERWTLMEQVAAMNLGGRVVLPGGHQRYQSRIIVGGSVRHIRQWESFPNALAEEVLFVVKCAGFSSFIDLVGCCNIE